MTRNVPIPVTLSCELHRGAIGWDSAPLAVNALDRAVSRRSDDVGSERIAATNGPLSHSVLGRDGAVYDPALAALDWEAGEHAQAVKAQGAIRIADHGFCRLMPSGSVP